jgi:hypothetical protein
MAKQTITPGKAPIVWSTVDEAFEKINANFTELYASVGGAGIEFDALESSLTPAQNDTYNLGAPNKRWASVYISDTLSIGGAAITNEGLTVDLPSGTTVGGQLIIDPDKLFFKEFSVNNETSVVADQFNDTLDFNAGVGIGLTVTSTNDQINITNTGVTSLVAGSGMTVSGATGAVTVTNAGVRSAVAGLGIDVNSATGAVTFSNSGIVEIESGNITSLTVSARDPVTGKVIITNTAPAGNAYRIVSVLNSVGGVENTLNANSTGATIQLQEGTGINLVGTTTPNKVVFENTGVLSLTAGNGITLSGSTGNINISIGRGDLIGSVFADDSTLLVDGVNGYIYGNVSATTLRTSDPRVTLGQGAGGDGLQGLESIAIGQSAGGFTQGDYAVAIGSGAGNIGQGNRAVAIGATAGVDQGDYAISIGNGSGYPSAVANSIAINASGFTLDAPAAGLYINPIRNQTSTGNVLTYNTTTKEIVYSTGFAGDVTGSVFADNSTRLIDGTEGKIVGPVESNTVTASSYIQTATYADLTAITTAIPTAVKGMIVFDDGTNQFRGFDGSSWVALN